MRRDAWRDESVRLAWNRNLGYPVRGIHVGAAGLYLDLLKRSLLGLTNEDDSNITFVRRGDNGQQEIEVRRVPHRRALRLAGRDWPAEAVTMIGQARLDHLHWCIDRIVAEDVPGDFIETGVWRGGAVIFMRGMLRVHNVTDRRVWAADSFRGFPTSKSKHDPQGPMPKWLKQCLAVPLKDVRRNFRRYGLLDSQVRFLEGWFRDTLPRAPIKQLAILRLDGDYYESTTDALTHLYDRVSPGGCIIVDDYNIPACRQAVTDFRERHRIAEIIRPIDGLGVFWRRERMT